MLHGKSFRLQIIFIMLGMLLMSGCTMITAGQDKIRDLDFTVLGEERIPKELLAEIEAQGEQAFTMAYSDGEFLYLVAGYGEQKGTGYCIAVEECYLTEHAIYVDTILLGPESPERTQETSRPYIVLKTENLEKTIIFQ